MQKASYNLHIFDLYASICQFFYCKRLIINAGIAQVVCRTGADEYTTTLVRDWVNHDDSIG